MSWRRIALIVIIVLVLIVIGSFIFGEGGTTAGR